MNDAPMFYLSQGQIDQMILWVFNSYIGYGIIWVLFGIMLFGVSYKKNKSAGLSGFVMAAFLGMVQALLPAEVQMYLAVLVAMLLFMVLYRVIR